MDAPFVLDPRAAPYLVEIWGQTKFFTLNEDG